MLKQPPLLGAEPRAWQLTVMTDTALNLIIIIGGTEPNWCSLYKTV